jgi:hypothetical protein
MKITHHIHAPHMALPLKGGAGTRLKEAIGQAVDASPLPRQTKARIKNCAGCGRRAERIDHAEIKARQAWATVRRWLGLAPNGKNGQSGVNPPPHGKHSDTSTDQGNQVP